MTHRLLNSRKEAVMSKALTEHQYDLKLFMYRLWLKTNPPMSEVIKENDKLADQTKNITYGRSINSADEST
jgi:hypothetical protein